MTDRVFPSSKQWSTHMITPACDSGQGTQGTFLSKEFIWKGDPQNIQLFISALGLYRAYLNIQRVGDDLLTPGWTCYDQRIAYQKYSLEDLIQPGRNTIEVWLGNGWYRSTIMWKQSEIINC